jgi:hypothetical protein
VTFRPYSNVVGSPGVPDEATVSGEGVAGHRTGDGSFGDRRPSTVATLSTTPRGTGEIARMRPDDISIRLVDVPRVM